MLVHACQDFEALDLSSQSLSYRTSEGLSQDPLKYFQERNLHNEKYLFWSIGLTRYL